MCFIDILVKKKKKSVVQFRAFSLAHPLSVVTCGQAAILIRKLPRRRNSESSRAAQAAQHQQRRANQREQILGQVRKVVFVQQPNQVRREVVIEAGQVIQPAERITVHQDRVAIQQQPVADPIQEDDEDVLQVQYLEDEHRN